MVERNGDLAQLDEESRLFLDLLNGSIDAKHRRLIKVLDYRFRTQRKRLLAMEQQVAAIMPLVTEIKALRRALVAVPAIVTALAGLARFMGWL